MEPPMPFPEEQEPALLRLSEELLILVVEQLKALIPRSCDDWEYSAYCRQLRALRLAHPRFAYSRHILQDLFEEIALSACKTRIDLRSLSVVGSHVKFVIFENSCIKSEHQGERIVEYIRSGKAQQEWTEAMQVMRNVRQVRISQAGCMYNGEQPKTLDDITALAINAMSTAGTQLHGLSFDACKTTDQCGPSALWRNLDLSALKILEVDQKRATSTKAFQSLLMQCFSTLEELNIDNSANVIPGLPQHPA